MTFQIALLLGILAVAIVFFVWEIVSAEVVALGILLALAIGGLIPTEEAFAGFGSDTVLMILGLLILTAALERTGLVDVAGRAVLTRAGSDPDRLFLLVVVSSCVLGAFISNTATTAFFLPVALGISRKSNLSPATLLMPLAFSSILSSSVTLVSTSTNVVVSGLLTHYHMEPMGMFELAPVGVPISLVGLIYVYYSRKWIPDRVKSMNFTEEFGLKDYLSEVVILPGSALAEKSLVESRIEEVMGLQVLRVIRPANGGAATRSLVPRGHTVLHEGDLLIVEGSQEDILKVKDAAGVEIKADIQLTDPSLADEDIALVEALVMPRSRLVGQTLKLQRFRERYGPQVLGINRHGVISVKKLSQTVIAVGDTLLLQGRPEDIARLHESGVLRVTSAMEALAEKRPRQRHAALAVTIFVGVLALATIKVMSLPLAVMLGAFLVFVTGCIRPQEAYAMIEWKAVILIGSILSLGSAMDHTGAAQYIAGAIVSAAGGGGASPYWLLTAFFVLSVLLTQPMSNQAAAVVVMPVAVHTAMQAGLNPRTFAMMVAVASSCSYLTPLEPACLMVHGPGQYRFMDFFKMGFPLTVLIYIIAILMVPWVWPLRG